MPHPTLVRTSSPDPISRAFVGIVLSKTAFKPVVKRLLKPELDVCTNCIYDSEKCSTCAFCKLKAHSSIFGNGFRRTKEFLQGTNFDIVEVNAGEPAIWICFKCANAQMQKFDNVKALDTKGNVCYLKPDSETFPILAHSHPCTICSKISLNPQAKWTNGKVSVECRNCLHVLASALIFLNEC
jgi:hypothetical protein